jgi:uncharacterized iron-regulated protein
MSTAARWLLTVVVSLALTGEAYAGVTITRMSDRQKISMSQLLTGAESSDLVLIGEAHDNIVHHEMQLSLIRALSAQKPIAIGLEMMQADSQRQLDEWTEGKLSEQNFQKVFAVNWSEDWRLYRNIFIFARDNHIPMIALNVPKEIVKKVSQHGFQSLTAEEKGDLPQGTTCDLNNPHTAFLEKSFKSVFTHVTNGKIFTYFCEAQTLRNSGMAMNIARYVKKHPGRKIVGLMGIWHAVRNAVPEQLERNGSKLESTVILPELPELKAANATAGEVDYLVGF